MDTEQAVAAQANLSASVPANVKEFEARLLEVADRLPKRLKQCADYVAANQDRIAVSTVAEMAEGAGVQSSAFMRFCQILGFSGFSEMQKLFADPTQAAGPIIRPASNTYAKQPQAALRPYWPNLPKPDAHRLKAF